MPSLTDVAPQTEEVTLGGGIKLQVRGVGVDAIARVLTRSESLRKLLTGQRPEPMELVKTAPDAAFALIAEAMGKPGDEATEQAARSNLYFGDQVTLIEAIFRLSFPGGVNPFFDKLVGMLGASGGAAAVLPGRVLGTSSQQP